jgi:tyrosine-protein kinase
MRMNPRPLELRDYVAIVWSRKWMIVAVATTATAVALFYSYRQTPAYSSSAQVVVRPSSPDDSPVILNMNTEQEVANSLPVARLAAGHLADLGVKPGRTKASLIEGTETILFTSVSRDPAAAQAAADAYANAYLEFRRNELLKELEDARRPYEIQIQTIDADIAEIESSLATIDDEGQRAVLSARYTSLLSERSLLRQRLNELPSPEDVQVGELLQDAELPTSPSTPNHSKDGALGLALGIVLGIGFAFFNDRLDRRVRGREELESYAGAPVLAFIPRFASKTLRGARDSNRPITLSDPQSEAAEAYKGLSVRLLHDARERGFKSIVITSSLPGEGKTSTTANLGVVLAQPGKRVVIVSADLRRPSLQTYFKGGEMGGLTQVLSRRQRLPNVLDSTDVQNLQVLHAGPPIESAGPLELLGSQEMIELLGELAGLADFVLLDTPPLLATSDVAALAPLTDGVLFVADPRVTQRPIVEQARHELEIAGVPVFGVVVNRFDPRKFRTYGYGYGYAYLPNGTPPGSDQAPRRIVQARHVTNHGVTIPNPGDEASSQAEVPGAEVEAGPQAEVHGADTDASPVAEAPAAEPKATPEAEVPGVRGRQPGSGSRELGRRVNWGSSSQDPRSGDEP